MVPKTNKADKNIALFLFANIVLINVQKCIPLLFLKFE
jgi:hypothetical protein